MPIRFSCAKCQTNFTVPDNAAGKTAKCKSCGQPISIPRHTNASTKAASEATAPTTRSATRSAKPKATFEVTSAINGAVFGPADRQTLESWIAEERVTPKCKIRQTGTQKWRLASSIFPSLAEDGLPGQPRTSSPSEDPLDVKIESEPENPFAGVMDSSSSASTTVRPYASSNVSEGIGRTTNRFQPTSGTIRLIINHSFQQFGEFIGPLFGATVLMAISILSIYFIFIFIVVLTSGAMAFSIQGNPRDAAMNARAAGASIGLVLVVLTVLASLGACYLSVGFIRAAISAGRGEPIKAMDIFDAGGRFLSFLGLSLLVGFSLTVMFVTGAYVVGSLAQQAGGIAGILGLILYLAIFIIYLAIWPSFFLVADGRANAISAISQGLKIGLKNIPQSFIIFLFVGLLSFFAIVGGLFITGPAALMVISSAYLNMTGQISKA